jgi:hypothetical protein
MLRFSYILVHMNINVESKHSWSSLLMMRLPVARVACARVRSTVCFLD